MTGSVWESWATTVVFATTGATSLVLLVIRRGGVFPRVLQGLHALMSVGMIGMAWALPVPPAVGIAVYGIATLLLAALWLRSAGPRGRPIADHPTWMLAVHAAMMAAMVWMSLPGGHGTAHGGGHDHGMGMPDVQLAIGLALTVGVLAGTVLSVAEAVLCAIRTPPRWRAHVLDDAVAALMGAGMSAMMLSVVLM